MSTSTPPLRPHDASLPSQQPDPPVPQSSTADLPPDPLLKSGFFISANSPTPTPITTATAAATTATATASATTATDANATTSAHTANKKSPKQATSNGSESQSTQPKRRPATEAGPELEWLPPSWLIEDRVRTSGATAGIVDRYYFDPASGRQFRSKKEVLYFLETGTPRKRKKGAESSDPDVEFLGSHGSSKQKSGTKGKTVPVPAPTNFDYFNAPEKIQWVLTKSSQDSWTPFMGKDKVPENTKREWAVAFRFLTMSSGGNKMS